MVAILSSTRARHASFLQSFKLRSFTTFLSGKAASISLIRFQSFLVGDNDPFNGLRFANGFAGIGAEQSRLASIQPQLVIVDEFLLV